MRREGRGGGLCQAARGLSSALISYCMYHSKAASHDGDSSKFISFSSIYTGIFKIEVNVALLCWRYLGRGTDLGWGGWGGLKHLITAPYLWWRKEERLRALLGFLPLEKKKKRHWLPAEGIQSSLRRFWMCAEQERRRGREGKREREEREWSVFRNPQNLQSANKPVFHMEHFSVWR